MLLAVLRTGSETYLQITNMNFQQAFFDELEKIAFNPVLLGLTAGASLAMGGIQVGRQYLKYRKVRKALLAANPRIARDPEKVKLLEKGLRKRMIHGPSGFVLAG